jgi:dTDP-4-dehydrorhamnose 3,5-epimerase-like enzyme
MGVNSLIFHVLQDGGDERGSSFALPATWLGSADRSVDVHVTTLVPGAVRGNHFHRARRELLIVVHQGAWSAHWDEGGEATPVHSRVFEGRGAVLIEVPPMVSHAVRNDGSAVLQITGLSDGVYNPAAPDAYSREVVAL